LFNLGSCYYSNQENAIENQALGVRFLKKSMELGNENARVYLIENGIVQKFNNYFEASFSVSNSYDFFAKMAPTRPDTVT